MTRYAVIADSVATRPGSDTVVIEDGKVVAVTDRRSIGEMPTTAHDGSVITGAFTDSHLHPLGYAALVAGTSLMEVADFEELEDRLREAAGRAPDGTAVIAQRLDDSRLGRLPTRRDLDRIATDAPILAYRYCGHVAVASSSALALAGVSADTPDPPGGSLDRDADGAPTGVLRETAIDLVAETIEPLAPPLTDDAVLAAFHGLAAVGISHVGGIVAASQGLWCGVGNELETLCRLAGDLPIDVDVIVITDTPESLRGAAERVQQAAGRVRFWGWKDFADGSLGGHTAAMWRPFVDEPANAGTLRLDPSHAEQMTRTALELEGVAAIHAIGDRAIDETLDVYDRLLAGGADPARLQVEHVSVPSDEAIRRLAGTGVVASVQPSFLTSESGWVPARLGPERPAYRFRTMAEAGVTMIGGSDCPVERPDPLAGITAAVQRAGWGDDEEVTVDRALDLFTTAPARHFARPEPLAPGSPADLVIVAGGLGTEGSRVEAVYRGGVAVELHPVEWPG